MGRWGLGWVALLVSAGVALGQAEKPALPEPGRPRVLDPSMWGSTGPGPVTVFDLLRSSLAQTICLTVNRDPKTPAQIAVAIEARESDVSVVAAQLAKEELLVRTEGGAYRANFVALDAEQSGQLIQLQHGAGAAAAKVIAANVERVRRAYADTPASRRGYRWEDGADWLVVGNLLCNAGLRRNSPVGWPDPPERPSGGRYWLVAREPMAGSASLRGMFCRTNNEPGLGYGVFGLSGAWRSLPNFSERARGALVLIAHGRAKDAAAVARLLECSEAEAQGAVDELASEGFVSEADGHVRVTFPVLGDDDSLLLTPIIDDIADQASKEALTPELGNLARTLDEWGYGYLREQFPINLLTVRTGAMGECLGTLVDTGVLPPYPNPPPAGFGCFGWLPGIPLVSWG
jgi:hypothetical protein